MDGSHPMPFLTAQPSQARSREVGVDLLRIVAAMAVVLIHIHYELIPGVALQTWFRGAARFAVPTFFALSGYFLAENQGLPTGALRRVPRVVLIFVLASLLYLPFALMQHRALSPLALLTGGTWLHLWFLPALALGLALVDVMVRLRLAKWWCWLLTLGLLTALVFADAASVLRGPDDQDARNMVVLLRFLQAFPMIWIGFSLARARHAGRTGALVFAGGCCLSIAQLVWYRHLGLMKANPEFLLGTLPVTIGLIVIARQISCPLSAYPALARFLAGAGARLTLPIYLLHPMAIVVLDRVWLALHGRPDVVVWAEILLLAPVMFAALWTLDLYAPRVIDVLNGTFRSRRGAVS